MRITARFYVQRMEKFAGNSSVRTFDLYPVTRGPENKTWASATPTGKITMGIGNTAAADWFESMIGKDVAVTFEARPMVCPRCGQEVVLGQYDQTAADGGHVRCPE